MKRFFLLAAFCAILSACGNPNKPLDSDISEDPTAQLPELPPDYAWMTLSTKFVFDEEPLRTKAGSSDDLYVVGVHQIIQAVMPHSGARYTDYGKYAYGVFDDLSHAIFKVAKSFHYGICVIYIPNGKNVLKNYGSDYYGAPCRSIYADSGSPDHQAAKLNEILYGYETPDLNWGFAETKDNTSGKLLWNTVERYQGFVDDWDPAQGRQVDIDLHRMMMGLRIRATDFKKGYLMVYGDEFFSIRYRMDPTSTGNTELDLEMETPWMPCYGSIDGLGVNTLSWNLEDYTPEEMQEIKERKINYGWGDVNITYFDESGKEMLLFTTSGMLMKRNTRYTLEFSLSDAVANQGIVTHMVIDDGGMEEQSLI